MRVLALTLLLTACPGPDTDSTDPPGPGWSMLSEDIPGGVLLSAWSRGDELLMVGGELRGPGHKGLIARYEAGKLCTEAVGERTLWWVHGNSDDDYYIVGEKGTILHHTGGELVNEDVQTEATLFGVWDEGDLTWAVGGNIDTGNGEIWRRSEGVWALHTGDLDGLVFKAWNGWFIGEELAFRLEGEELVAYPPGERLLTVRGSSKDDVWAVGGLQSARVMHFDSGAWEPVDNALGQALNGVWTAADEDVWIAGNFGVVARYDGSEWHKPARPLTDQHFHAVWKHNDEMFAVGGNMFSTSNFKAIIARYGESGDTVSASACQ